MQARTALPEALEYDRGRPEADHSRIREVPNSHQVRIRRQAGDRPGKTQKGFIMTLGEKLYALRKNENWTLAELGEQVGLNAGTISKYENDKSYPSPSILRKLECFFNVKPGYLADDPPVEETKYRSLIIKDAYGDKTCRVNFAGDMDIPRLQEMVRWFIQHGKGDLPDISTEGRDGSQWIILDSDGFPQYKAYIDNGKVIL